MNVTIIGTGNMARGIATRMLEGGNSVVLVGQQPGDADELVAELQETASGGTTVTTTENRLQGDVVVLAVPYAAAGSVVQEYSDQLEGKIIIDITNPVD
ncbi:MAG TPA: NAD(P)-binding domain-containing protein, partial [Candidatus Sulfomarinibacteraceae bacterium]|nr:NAD(P)-binding domain-containing protein [Candidatus Sulfomarinibacteraceae bacterium]